MQNVKPSRVLRGTIGMGPRVLKAAIRRLPGGEWFLRFTDPLHIARSLLGEAMERRASLVRGFVLDVGCGSQPYRGLFDQAQWYVGMDIPPNDRADVLGDAMALPFRDEAFDTAICNEVIEHVPEPAFVMSEVARVLRPGGTLILTTPQTWGLHHEPHDYFRYTHYGLKYLAQKAQLDILEITPTCGVWATVAQRLADTLAHVVAANRGPALLGALSWLLAPVQIAGLALDRVFGKRGDTLDNVLVATKPLKERTTATSSKATS